MSYWIRRQSDSGTRRCDLNSLEYFCMSFSKSIPALCPNKYSFLCTALNRISFCLHHKVMALYYLHQGLDRKRLLLLQHFQRLMTGIVLLRTLKALNLQFDAQFFVVLLPCLLYLRWHNREWALFRKKPCGFAQQPWNVSIFQYILVIQSKLIILRIGSQDAFARPAQR